MYSEAGAPGDNGYDRGAECIEFRSIPRMATHGEAVAAAPAAASFRLLTPSAARSRRKQKTRRNHNAIDSNACRFSRLAVATESNLPRRFANSDVACPQRFLRQSQTSDSIRGGQGAYACGLTCGAAALMDQSPSTRA